MPSVPVVIKAPRREVFSQRKARNEKEAEAEVRVLGNKFI